VLIRPISTIAYHRSKVPTLIQTSHVPGAASAGSPHLFMLVDCCLIFIPFRTKLRVRLLSYDTCGLDWHSMLQGTKHRPRGVLCSHALPTGCMLVHRMARVLKITRDEFAPDAEFHFFLFTNIQVNHDYLPCTLVYKDRMHYETHFSYTKTSTLHSMS
jgi:hypothetical protein